MFCSYCGGKLDQEAKFCTFCGKEPSSAPKAPMQEASIQTQTPTGPIQQPASLLYNRCRRTKYGIFQKV